MKSNDLEGLLVVSVEQAVAAPYVSSRLAEAGARVIKIERPEGDFARGYDDLVHGESAYFVWLNRGKESVCMDLRDERARQTLANMIAKADIFIQNLAPGAIDRLGFAPARLREEHPKLITLSISGYGDEGPFQHLKAYDLLVQAESGLSSITGTPDGMTRVGVSVCDIAAGMTAFQAVLQALIARGKTGQGRHLSISLFHALTDWMNVPYLQYVYGGRTLERNGLTHPTIAPYGAYAGSDRKEVLFSIQNEREWAQFCAKVLGRPELATEARFGSNSRRVENRRQLNEIIDAVFGSIPRDELAKRLQAAGIAFGRVSTMEDLAGHPQNRYVDVDSPSGPVRMLAPGALVDGMVMQPGAVPALGQHTEAVLAEFSNPQAA